MTATPTTVSIDRLRDGLDGRVIVPGDADYDEARVVTYGGIDKRPARDRPGPNAEDVARVVRFARETGAELAVRSGGHSGAGHSTTEGGIVIDLRELKRDRPRRRRPPRMGRGRADRGRATRGGHAARARHRLRRHGSVGIGGITTGGGVGYLVRRDGLTIDNLIGAEIVTADGEVLAVDADNHPDLFWAIRGGGGNFGVVTKFHYRLNEMPAFFGGMLVLPATAETLPDSSPRPRRRRRSCRRSRTS